MLTNAVDPGLRFLHGDPGGLHGPRAAAGNAQETVLIREPGQAAASVGWRVFAAVMDLGLLERNVARVDRDGSPLRG